MSRERFLHPELLESEDYHSLSFAAQSLFVGLIVLADDEGRGKASPRSLIGTIFPGRGITAAKLETMQDELVKRDMVRFYKVEGSNYYMFPSWSKYQHPRYVKPSKVPVYQEDCDSFIRSVQVCADLRGIRGRVGKGRDGKGRVGDGKGVQSVQHADAPSRGFSEWWNALRPWFKAANRRLGYKSESLAYWKEHGLAEYADLIIERTIQQRQHYTDAVRSNERPVPPQDPIRYLKNRRYNDETP